MKIQVSLLFCIAFAAVNAHYISESSSDDVHVYGALENTIMKIVNNLKNKLPEPISIPETNVTFPVTTKKIISGGLGVKDFELHGIKNFSMTNLKISLKTMSMNFTIGIEDINLNTNYWADFLLMQLIPGYGNGKANVHLKNLQLLGTGKVSLSPLSLHNLSLIVSLEDATFDLHGILNNEEFSIIVGEVLDDMVTRFIKEEQELITRIVSPIAEVLINKILGGSDADPTDAPKPDPTASPIAAFEEKFSEHIKKVAQQIMFIKKEA